MQNTKSKTKYKFSKKLIANQNNQSWETIKRIIITTCVLSPALIPEALAIDLEAMGKAFFDPVVAFSKAYAPIAIFIGGVLGMVLIPGDKTAKVAGGAGFMAAAGLLVKAAEKGFGV